MSGKEPTGGEANLISSQRVYEGKLLKIDRDDVALPGGRRTILETIRHPGAAAAVPFVDDENVVLIRQYRHAVGGYILEVPAGKLDAGEAPETCITRELGEEIGLRPARLEPPGRIVTTPGFTDEVIWLYEAHELSPCEPDHQTDEVIESVTMSFNDAIEAVRAGRVYDAKSVAALLAAWLRRRG